LGGHLRCPPCRANNLPAGDALGRDAHRGYVLSGEYNYLLKVVVSATMGSPDSADWSGRRPPAVYLPGRFRQLNRRMLVTGSSAPMSTLRHVWTAPGWQELC